MATTQRNRSKALLLASFATLTAFSYIPVSPVSAAIIVNPGGPQEQPLEFAYVRGSDNKMYLDFAFAADIAAQVGPGKRYGSVDIVMQQCFGGGFANDVATALDGINYTFASAGSYQTVINTDRPLLGGDPARRIVDNFTRAWRADADLYMTQGMRAHYNTAAAGRAATHRNPGIAKDPAAVPTIRTDGEENFPQFRANAAADEARTIGGDSQYAILAAWSTNPAARQGDRRHEVNVARMHNTLTNPNVYALPGAREAILTPRAAPALPNGVGPDDLGGLGGAPRNDSASRTIFQNTVGGAHFPGQAAAQANKLLVYFTGHGGDFRDLRNIYNSIRTSIINGIRYALPAGAFRFVAPAQVDEDLTFSYEDGTQLVQLSFLTSAESQVDASTLTINGVPIGPMSALKVPASSALSMDPILLDPLVNYQVLVPTSLLGSNLALTNFDLTGIDLPTADLIRGFAFAGGDQEAMVLVPEPTTLLLLATLPLLPRIRRPR